MDSNSTIAPFLDLWNYCMYNVYLNVYRDFSHICQDIAKKLKLYAFKVHKFIYNFWLYFQLTNCIYVSKQLCEIKQSVN